MPHGLAHFGNVRGSWKTVRVQNGVSKSTPGVFVKNSSTFWFCLRRCDLHRMSVVSATAIALAAMLFVSAGRSGVFSPCCHRRL